MNRYPSVICVFFTFFTFLVWSSLGTVLTAQSGVTAPPGFESTAGSFYTYQLGRWPKGRVQFADGSANGSAHVIQNIRYRLDPGRTYDTWTGNGRSWTSVQLFVAQTDVDKMNNFWTKNALTTPTKVYDSNVTWKSVSGMIPSPSWGSHVAFPFSSVYVHPPKKDLLLDYTFQGGTLTGGGTWSGYYLDGVSVGSAVSTPGTYRPAPQGQASLCRDSAFAQTWDATPWARLTVYSDAHATNKGKVELTMSTSFTAPHRPVIHAIGVLGTFLGVDVGARCNRLYANPQTSVLLFRTADIAGRARTRLPPTAYPSSAVGATLWIQGAWSDSKSGQLSLTTAWYDTVPGKPVVTRKKTIWSARATSGPSFGPSTAAALQSLPLLSPN